MILFLSCKKEKTTLQWTKVNSGNGNPVNSIYFLNKDTGYAAGGLKYETGTVFQTIDGGKTWTSKSMGEKAFYSVRFRNGQHGFVTGNDGFVFRTTDGGNTWNKHQTDADWGKEYRCIEWINDSTAFIACGRNYKKGYLLKTTDRGNSWSEKTFERELRSIVFTSETTGFASGYGIIYKTTDGGENWNPTEAKGDFFVAMDFPGSLVGYAVGYEGTIVKTSDGGSSWKKLRNGNNILLKNLQFEAVDFMDENTGYAVGRKGAMIKTDDGGDNWSLVEKEFSENIKSVFLLSASSGFVTTEDGNIYRFEE